MNPPNEAEQSGTEGFLEAGFFHSFQRILQWQELSTITTTQATKILQKHRRNPDRLLCSGRGSGAGLGDRPPVRGEGISAAQGAVTTSPGG